MDNSAAVHVEALSKKYKQVQALYNVHLKIEPGQIFGLLGPNGAGKTTLIRLLVGAIKSSSGHCSVLGLDPIKNKSRLRRQIGYMPQEPALYDDLSARDNIRFFGNAHQVENITQKVNTVIEFVGLTDRANDPVYTFSGGMKQRVSLACSLVHQPQILFLDEPTSGIDPQLREAFWQHFRTLCEEGKTIIISTHQMDEATHCNTLAILHEGEVLASESPQQLLWNNRAKIKVWRNDQLFLHEVSDYPQQLPVVLQTYGLDPSISRIEVEEDTLEEVVLRMIAERKGNSMREGKDESRT